MDWNVILGGVAIVQTLALFYVGAKASKIDQLESRLQEAADRRIDEKFAAMTQQCAMRHSGLDKRLESGDRHFQESREAEKLMARDIAEIREKMATRQDFKDLAEKIDEMRP